MIHDLLLLVTLSYVKAWPDSKLETSVIFMKNKSVCG